MLLTGSKGGGNDASPSAALISISMSRQICEIGTSLAFFAQLRGYRARIVLSLFTPFPDVR